MKSNSSEIITKTFRIFDFLLIILTTYFTVPDDFFNTELVLFLICIWYLFAFYSKFYQIHRYTTLIQLTHYSVIQYLLFFMGYYTYTGIVYEGSAIGEQLITFTIIFLGSFFMRFQGLFLLRFYRIEGKGFKVVVGLGASPTMQRLQESLSKRRDYGYRFLGTFCNNPSSVPVLGSLEEYKAFCLENNVEEMFCSLSDIPKPLLKDIIDFADRNLIKVNLVPDEKGPLKRSIRTNYIGHFPVLQFRPMPLENIEVRFVKRLFDIVFSSFVIIGILSWLYPILGILIKKESKGPILFKQKRDGVGGTPFWCYKFRSMGVNRNADSNSATRNDPRITKLGAFMRRTSLDELPQFINVFLGDMSVVGPRPHMIKHTKEFSLLVDKYMVRHFVKPGITGLAQVSGFRGEIQTQTDILNRIRYDVFYVENWSFLLDTKIIIKTVTNVFKGEEKAY